MKVLALDLSTKQGSIAFGGSCDDLEEINWPNENRNSGPFFDNLQQIRARYGAADVVVTGLGPGSYAGTRISVAAATGLAFAWNAQLLGAPSVCAFPGKQASYFIIGDARRNAFFCAEIRERILSRPIELLTLEEIRQRLQADGDLAVFTSDSLPQFPQARIGFPSARELARLALTGSKALVSSPLQPLYLREPSITLPKGQHPVTR